MGTRPIPPENRRPPGNFPKRPAPGHWVNLRYTEISPIRVYGPATGQRYEFSASNPVQRVDQKDAALLLRLPYFRAEMRLP